MGPEFQRDERTEDEHDGNLQAVHGQAGEHERRVARRRVVDDAQSQVHGVDHVQRRFRQDAPCFQELRSDTRRQGLIDFRSCCQGGIAEHVVRRIDSQHEGHGPAELDLLRKVLRNRQSHQGPAAAQRINHLFRTRDLSDDLEFLGIAVSLDDRAAERRLLFITDDQGNRFDAVLPVNDAESLGKGQRQEEEDGRHREAPLPETVPFFFQDRKKHLTHLPCTGSACPAAEPDRRPEP